MSKDTIYMGIAKAASLLSKDIKAKVGAVALSKNRIVSIGVNGYPSGYDDTNQERKHDKIIHAEINAILNYGGNIHDIDTLYIYGLPPCPDCMKFLAALSIRTVIFAINPTIRSKGEWLELHKTTAYLHPRIKFYLMPNFGENND